MRKDWHGLVKILEAQHIRNGKVIWEAKNLYNLLHAGGELFFLTCCFQNDGSFPPEQYYFGLDNRPTLDVADLMTDLVDEPVGNGYLRQAVSSTDGFSLDVSNNVYRAASQILTFSATTGGWGPVNTLFLTTAANDDGILLASAPLSNEISLDPGDSFNMRMSLSLRDAD